MAGGFGPGGYAKQGGGGVKHWKKGLLAAALCVLLALGIAIPVFGSSGTVYLMAVNERVLEVTGENMPVVMNGILYVPYTMLSRDTGINLGVSAQYSTTRRTVLVSDGKSSIVFDVQASTAQDQQGNPVQARAMVRNSMIFLPIDYLCIYFGSINCSRMYSKYGIVVRVTNASAVLQDSEFVSAADSLLADSLRGYYASIAPPETAAPTVKPPTPTASPVQAEVLLALRWGEQGEELARLLESRSERAMFLFTVEELRERDDAARRLIAAGHTVGLALTGGDAGTCAVELEEGRRLLAEIARYHALVVSAGALDDKGRETLRKMGCSLWSPSLRGKDYRTGVALVEVLVPKAANQVELECGAGSVAFFRSVLAAMDRESCALRQPTAPVLS